MDQSQWDVLADAFKACKSANGTFHYNFDTGLSRLIDHYAEANLDDHKRPKSSQYGISPEEVHGAIANWIKAQQILEEAVCSTHVHGALSEHGFSPSSQQKVCQALVRGKKLLGAGHTTMRSYGQPFPHWYDETRVQVMALWDMAMLAVQEFERTPTAFITFPNQQIDPQVFAGFYGIGWSRRYNICTLRALLWERLPCFKVEVVATRECYPGKPDSHRDYTTAGILFHYRSPWSD